MGSGVFQLLSLKSTAKTMRNLLPYVPIFVIGIAAFWFDFGMAVNSYSQRESRLGPVTEVYLNPLDTCQTLADSIDHWDILYPEWFERIAWIETNSGTAGVGELNNLFGMRCHSRATQASCHASGYGEYATRSDAIADLALWMQYSPPWRIQCTLPVLGIVTFVTEHPYAFLTRRGWQPRAWMPKYWQALNSLSH